MTYKTILVHLNDSRRAKSRAGARGTTGYTLQFSSHGLHVYGAVPAPPIPMASAALGSILAAERTNSDAIADTSQRLTRNKQFVAEWQLQKVPHLDLARVVMGADVRRTRLWQRKPILTGTFHPASSSVAGRSAQRDRDACAEANAPKRRGRSVAAQCAHRR
jgi:hypothetical protein